MGVYSYIWAINPSTSTTRYRAAAAVGTAGALTLLTQDAGPNGVGYKVAITSDGDDLANTFTIVGIKVGDLSGKFTTETVTGPDTATVTSTNFYAFIESISISGTSANDISLGTSGDLALPRTRVKAFYVVCGSSTGSLKININGLTTGNNTIFDIATPAGVTITQDLILPGAGILTARQTTDYSVVVPTNLTDYTLFCG